MKSLLLNRHGNKNKIAKNIISLFPEHNIYIECFFGAGGIFFNKPLAKKSILNDIDDDVYNLYTVIQNNKDELIKQWDDVIIHNSLFKYWIKNKETDPIRKAIRFLYLSNLSYLGTMETMKIALNNSFHYKTKVNDNIDNVYNMLKKAIFSNKDVISFLKSFSERHPEKLDKKIFVYCDPPYINTDNNYKNNFSLEEFTNMIDLLISKRLKFAISEQNNNKILEIAKSRNLNIFTVKTILNQVNQSYRKEILITNYDLYKQNSFFYD